MGDESQGVIRPISTASAERQELAAVIASPTFSRSQRLVKLLEYIAEKHFTGKDNEVCEYGIATEVLGRPAEFDPAQDAIARVEIHRLRKKLREYYSAEGAHQTLKIIIPPGMYTPVFQKDGNNGNQSPVNGKAIQETVSELPAERLASPDPAEAERLVIAPAKPVAKRRAWLIAASAVVVVLVGAGIVAFLRSNSHSEPETLLRQPPPPGPAAPADQAVRIVAGYDRKYIDHHGRTWLPDRYFEGGGRPSNPYRQFIARTADPLLYQNGRLGLTGYKIPLDPGTYELRLHFVEPVYGPGLETGGGENSRVFDVLVNGKILLSGFDIVSDAGGPLIADVRVFKDIQPGPDGILRLGFHAQREQPFISAIEIEPAQPHKLNPIRIVTQPNSVIDSAGHVWEADNYYWGGQTSNHWKAVTGTPDEELFSNERYGHFSYAIPVAPGSYSVTMQFAETYWGKSNEGGGGPGQRVFDIFCNGSALARNLDILKEAGPNKALTKKFKGLHPNAQGKLRLDFVPESNYASVFAIEVLDESR